ncbi:hypothetical protein Tco_1012285 [Tanacetum coccineum]
MTELNQQRIRSKENCDGLINQVNLKSVEISDLNASLREKVLVITALKDDLRKLKGKALVDNAVTKHTIDPEVLKIDVEPITPKLLNNKTAYYAYIKHTQEEAAVLKDLVEHVKANYPLDHPLESAYRVRSSTSASGSQPSGNTKKDKTQRPSSSTLKNKVKAHPRKDVYNIGYFWGDLRIGPFIIVGNAYPLTRITTTAEVPFRINYVGSDTPKPVVTLVYSKEPKKSKTNVPVSKPKNIKLLSANQKEPSKSWGSIVSDVPSSSLDEYRSSKLFSGICTPTAPSI